MTGPANYNKQRDTLYVPTAESAVGTYGVGSVVAAYTELVALFGQPNGVGSCDGKTTTEWWLTGPHGTVVTIYDWKMTSMYSPGLPPPSALRTSKRIIWNIGAFSKYQGKLFQAWLERRLYHLRQETQGKEANGGRGDQTDSGGLDYVI